MYKLCDFKSTQENPGVIKFIDLITEKWSNIHNQTDVFRYKIDNIQEKVLEENYLLQLNPNRSTKRRAPEQIENLIQPFDGNKFNFTKASLKEIMFKLEDDDSEIHVMFVNVSPISRYHSLLCPSLEKCLPQIITEDSLLLVLKIMFIARDRDLRIGFNSLCALASVNHLHYHLFLEKNNLPVETAMCTQLHKEVYYLNNYPIPGFCFEVSKENVSAIARAAFKLIAYFLKKSIAHNIFITRGCSLSGSQETIRLVVWPRKSSAGAKQLAAFNVAVCEMSGWFPVYSATDYETLTKQKLENELIKWRISDFKQLCYEIKEIM